MDLNTQDDRVKWTIHNFPFPKEDLNATVQAKAVEIANELYFAGEPANDALIKKAVSKAEEWFLEMEG